MLKYLHMINYTEASISFEFTADSLVSSPGRTSAERPSMAEFSCAIFSDSFLRVLWFYHSRKKKKKKGKQKFLYISLYDKMRGQVHMHREQKLHFTQG